MMADTWLKNWNVKALTEQLIHYICHPGTAYMGQREGSRWQARRCHVWGWCPLEMTVLSQIGSLWVSVLRVFPTAWRWRSVRKAHLAAHRLSTGLSLWQKGATGGFSFPFCHFHPSVAFSILQSAKKKKIKKGLPLVFPMLNLIQIVRHLKTDKTLSTNSPSFPLLSEEIINKNDLCVGGERKGQGITSRDGQSVSRGLQGNKHLRVHTNT